MKVYFIMPLMAIALSGAISVGDSNSSDDIFGPFYNGYTTTCEHSSGNLVRTVRVQYFDKDSHLPCEVRYAKPTEHPDAGYRVLWHAHNREGYCERKAKLLVGRLAGWGWQCGEAVWSENDTTGDPRHEHDRAPDDSSPGGSSSPEDEGITTEPVPTSPTPEESRSTEESSTEESSTEESSTEESSTEESRAAPTPNDCDRYGGYYCD